MIFKASVVQIQNEKEIIQLIIPIRLSLVEMSVFLYNTSKHIVYRSYVIVNFTNFLVFK